MDKVITHSRKVLIGVAGGIVTLIGLVLVPYPGPGWLVVFAGLAILATEFTFAERILAYGRHKYEAWKVWLKQQTLPVRFCALLMTGIVVVVSLWLFNAFGIVIGIFNLPFDWLVSPLFR